MNKETPWEQIERLSDAIYELMCRIEDLVFNGASPEDTDPLERELEALRHERRMVRTTTK